LVTVAQEAVVGKRRGEHSILMVRSASEFIIGPRFARTRWRVSNHPAPMPPSFETHRFAMLLRMRVWRAPDAYP
jgi:hypothetical protein